MHGCEFDDKSRLRAWMMMRVGIVWKYSRIEVWDRGGIWVGLGQWVEMGYDESCWHMTKSCYICAIFLLNIILHSIPLHQYLMKYCII